MTPRTDQAAALAVDRAVILLPLVGTCDAAQMMAYQGVPLRVATRLMHTTSKTGEIYIKEAIPDVSAIDMKLPWESI